MNASSTSRLVFPLLAVLLALGLGSGFAQAEEFGGRGVFQFASASGCPLATTATPLSDCNRIALDDGHTRARLDGAGKTLVLRNGQDYADETVIADVLLHGQARAQNGQVVPVSLHLLISKEGQAWSTSLHAHAPVAGDLREVRIDAYRVEAEVQGKRQTLLHQDHALQVLSSPSTAARLAKQFVQVRDNRVEAAKAEYADITIALGVGPAALPALRASLHVPGGHAELAKTLHGGSWTLELQALRSRLPLSVIRRDLFLFGLERVALLQPLQAEGFSKYEKLLLGAQEGKGYLSYRGQRIDYPQAGAVAQAFLQDSFIGLVLSAQQHDAAP
ncbi:hypothetical protein F3I16_07545 [Pseudomonas sp. L-22-4S-12]|uniref:hypothetical protein n=1 Tax=Pseudomonas sp. L-22-4S-12 TaxID=2610893 RepID=UPI001324D1F2|nr:hypothetical protein [Pseudomonas sp. L-22-4S-12]MWV15906.1 hypothetical protein [Pseudomonas sp. L-22-4S-12]